MEFLIDNQLTSSEIDEVEAELNAELLVLSLSGTAEHDSYTLMDDSLCGIEATLKTDAAVSETSSFEGEDGVLTSLPGFEHFRKSHTQMVSGREAALFFVSEAEQLVRAPLSSLSHLNQNEDIPLEGSDKKDKLFEAHGICDNDSNSREKELIHRSAVKQLENSCLDDTRNESNEVNNNPHEVGSCRLKVLETENTPSFLADNSDHPIAEAWAPGFVDTKLLKNAHLLGIQENGKVKVKSQPSRADVKYSDSSVISRQSSRSITFFGKTSRLDKALMMQDCPMPDLYCETISVLGDKSFSQVVTSSTYENHLVALCKEAEFEAAARIAADECRRREMQERRRAVKQEEEMWWTSQVHAATILQTIFRGYIVRKRRRAKRLEFATSCLSSIVTLNSLQFAWKTWVTCFIHQRRTAFEMRRDELQLRLETDRLHRASRIQNEKMKASISIQCIFRIYSAKKNLYKKRHLLELLRAQKAAAMRFRKERENYEQKRRRHIFEQRKTEISQSIQVAMEEFKQAHDVAADEKQKVTRKINEELFGKPKVVPKGCEVLIERERRYEKCIDNMRHRKAEKLTTWRLDASIPPPFSVASSTTLSSEEISDSISFPRQGIDTDVLESLGPLSELQSIALNVEGIEDASALADGGATSLKHLSMNVNKISPDLQCFSGLPTLTHLSLSDNCLTALDGIEHLTLLEELNVDANRLRSLFPLGDIDGVPSCCLLSLRSLSARANQIKHLSSRLGEKSVPFLESLSLYQNRITHIPDDFLRGLDCLISLDLGRNRLSDEISLGKTLSAAPTLRCLVLSQNRLKRLPHPLGLPLLKELWLTGNDVTSTEGWSRNDDVWLPCLWNLHLQDNCISTITENSLAYACPNLVHFDLSFNEISSCDCIRRELRHLKYLER